MRQKILLLMLLSTLIGCASLTEDETENWTAKQFYDEAKKAMEAGAFSDAISNYNKLEARFPYGLYAQQAQLDTAFAHYQNEEPDAAVAAADRFIKLHPRHESVDYAYYIRGLATYDLEMGKLERMAGQNRSDRDPQRIRQSFNFFNDLVQRFPTSRYRKDAVERMIKLRNALAEHELQVAEFYLQQQAYVAAANRAKYVVENYQQTPSTARALVIMSEAYDKLQLPTLAASSREVHDLNFATTANGSGNQQQDSSKPPQVAPLSGPVTPPLITANAAMNSLANTPQAEADQTDSDNSETTTIVSTETTDPDTATMGGGSVIMATEPLTAITGEATIAEQPAETVATDATNTESATANRETVAVDDAAIMEQQPPAKAAITIPHITGISPNPVIGSRSRQTITIYGALFPENAQIEVCWPKKCTVLPASRVKVIDDKTITMRITTGVNNEEWSVSVIGEQPSTGFTFHVQKPKRK